MKTHFLSGALVLTTAFAAQAQMYNDADMYNDALVSDWDTQWFNTSNGTYSGDANGIFEHYAPSSQTFVNDGSYSTLPGHIDRFLGPGGTAGAQEIAGTNAPGFYNLELVNGNASLINITNAAGANVSGTATFSNGITTTVRATNETGALRFQSGASYTHTGVTMDDAHHVNGYVSKVGADPFVFPVGSGTDLRTLEMSDPGVFSAHISVAWFGSDPGTTTDPSDGTTHSRTSVGAGIQGVSPAGFWDWVPVVGAAAPLTVTVSIPDVTGFATTANLRLVGWDGTQWIDLSGAATASGNTENSTLSGTVPAGTGITAIGIGSVAFPLPVQIGSFSAQASECSAQLHWNSGTETNVRGFEVEHSHDGITFRVLGFVAAAGSGSNYSFTHNDPASGNNSYRLRIVEQDGSRYSSATAATRISCDGRNGIRVFPNPAADKVSVSGLESGSTIRVLNVTGEVLVDMRTTLASATIDLGKLPSATYLLQVLSGSEVVHAVLLSKQ